MITRGGRLVERIPLRVLRLFGIVAYRLIDK